jgi:hypothetical protein
MSKLEDNPEFRRLFRLYMNREVDHFGYRKLVEMVYGAQSEAMWKLDWNRMIGLYVLQCSLAMWKTGPPEK